MIGASAVSDIRARFDYPKGRPSWLIPQHGRDAHLADAIHESGHAIVGSVLGLAIEKLTIIPARGHRWFGDYDGLCHFSADLSKEPAEIEIVVNAAGAIGQELFHLGRASDCHCKSDWTDIENRLAEIPAPQRRAFWLACVSKAESILIARLRQLVGLAKYLHAKRELTGNQVQQFLEYTK